MMPNALHILLNVPHMALSNVYDAHHFQNLTKLDTTGHIECFVRSTLCRKLHVMTAAAYSDFHSTPIIIIEFGKLNLCCRNSIRVLS